MNRFIHHSFIVALAVLAGDGLTTPKGSTVSYTIATAPK